MSDDDIDQEIKLLVEMMKKIRHMLSLFTENYRIIIPEYPDFSGDFKNNWPLIDEKFNDLDNHLIKLKDKTLLEREGLTGDQLQLKYKLLLSAYDEAYEKYEEFRKLDDNHSEKPEKLSWYRKLANLFFKHGNSVLGSMADAGVPFVGVIGEFKDAAEITLERAENKKRFSHPNR